MKDTGNDLSLPTDYLKVLLQSYYPLHFFAVYRAHELFSVEPYISCLADPILDLGCGDGIIAQLLFGRQLEYGIDSSVGDVVAAQKRGAYKTVFHGDAHNIPLEAESVGGVFSNCVLEHIPHLSAVIGEVARILKPGARFVATAVSPHYFNLNPVFRMFDKPGTRWLRRKMIDAENQLHNHVSVFDVQEYRRIFQLNGLSLEIQQYYATKNVAEFCSKWDTASKYIVPFPVHLRHDGYLVRSLRKRYRRGLGLSGEKEITLRLWYERFRQICYSRNNRNEVGAAQILVAQKKP